MPVVGPFDRRRHLLRCIPCASSHLKAGETHILTTSRTDLQSLQCSGGKPCANCLRRQKHCELPTRDLAIKIDRQTPSHLLEVCNGFRIFPLSQNPPFDKQTCYVAGFFKSFLAKNSFTGRRPSYCLGMQGSLASLDSLLNIVSAIGALQNPGVGQSFRGFSSC